MNTESNETFPFADASEDMVESGQHAAGVVRKAAHCAADSARTACQTVKEKADDSMTCSREFVRQHPMTVVLGALAVGAVVGYVIATRQQHQPTLRERFAGDPLNAARDAVFGVLAPVSRKLHHQYDSARDGAGRALEKLHRIHPSRCAESWADQLGRVGSNLKFW